MKLSSNRFKALFGALLVCALVMTARADARIATIDLRKVFDKYYKRAQAEQNLKDKGAAMEKEQKSLIDEYQKSKDDYEKLLAAANDQSVTPAERDKRKSLAETKLLDLKGQENSIKRFVDGAREQIDLQRKRMVEQLLEDIRAAVNAKAKAAGYSMVLDTAAESLNQSPILLYTDGSNDLTDAILNQLNAAAPVMSTTDPVGKTSPDSVK